MNTFRKLPLNSWSNGCRLPEQNRQGFTLVELLVVLAALAVLTTVLLPALAAPQSDGKAFQCLNNTKRLTTAWLMYASDNDDRLLPNPGWLNGGTMDWGNNYANIDVASMLTNAWIATYVKSTVLFKCPADVYQSPQNPGPRIRSYALNAGVGGAPALTPAPSPQYPAGRTYSNKGAVKMTDLNTPGPAKTWVVVDEHPDSINDGSFYFNAGYEPSMYEWRDFPASHHDGACGFSFADGHAEMHRWLETARKFGFSTIQPVTFTDWPFAITGSSSTMVHCEYSRDYAWMNDGMPYRLK
jgi:prepilin-type N-terminal cleavage/methylation domain-containing protein